MAGVVILITAVLFFGAASPQAEQALPRSFGNENLLAEDIGLHNSIEGWCGNEMIIVSGEGGIRLFDIKTGKWTLVQESYTNNSAGCTPDGRWFFYLEDSESFRPDGARVVEEFDPESFAGEWQGYVVDLVRYEVATGKRDIFAVVRNFREVKEIVSPDGKKVFLGHRVNTRVEMPEPKLEDHWYSNNWESTYYPQWLADSSGIVVDIVDNNYENNIGVEVFGKDGWAKVFPWDKRELGRIEELKAGKDDDFFLKTSVEVEVNGRKEDRYTLFHCGIEDKKLGCETLFSQKDKTGSFFEYSPLPDGGIVIRRFSGMLLLYYPPKAFIRIASNTDFFEVSPDGKKIIFVRRKTFKKNGEYKSLYLREIGK